VDGKERADLSKEVCRQYLMGNYHSGDSACFRSHATSLADFNAKKEEPSGGTPSIRASKPPMHGNSGKVPSEPFMKICFNWSANRVGTFGVI
jgi:hypothetical protein